CSYDRPPSRCLRTPRPPALPHRAGGGTADGSLCRTVGQCRPVVGRAVVAALPLLHDDVQLDRLAGAVAPVRPDGGPAGRAPDRRPSLLRSTHPARRSRIPGNPRAGSACRVCLTRPPLRALSASAAVRRSRGLAPAFL